MQPAIRLFDDAEAVACAAAELLARASEAVEPPRVLRIALAGGSTPAALYRRLAAAPAPALPWSRTLLLFGDERHVGPDHPDSNYRMVRETLLDRLLDPPHVLRVRGELSDPHAAAREYERELVSAFPGERPPRLDVVLLGIGEDGHTASLFPGSPALEERERWVVATQVPRLGDWRITLTLPVLCAAREVVFLVTGERKAAVLAEALARRTHDPLHPWERVVPVRDRRTILADRAAAGVRRRRRGQILT